MAVARPGAVLPDGRKLKSAKLRGIVSEGMILSEVELAVGTEHGGIMVLDSSLAPGLPLDQAIELSSDVIEFEITPNRVDCLGVYGIAREVHASTGAPLAPAPWVEDPGSSEGDAGGAEVVVEVPQLCSRFMVRAFEGIRIGPSPGWLKARLVGAGMRPISNVVDITNYVMLLTGQPLHAFDFDRVAGRRLVVRRAAEAEQIDTLDGETRTLDGETVVICDADGPTSIAGIMGGGRSEVESQTTRVLLEAATWNGANIQRSSVRLGLRSEASGRFEKGLEPEMAEDGLAYATRLLVELCDARILPGTVDVGGPGPAAKLIPLRPARVAALLGKQIGADRCAEILTALEFGVTPAAAVGESGVLDGGGGLDVTVPYFRRSDVTREVDLIEEVARIDGVDRLPATLPPRNGAAGRLTHAQRARRRAEDVLVGRGLNEVVGWSFTDSGLPDRLRLPDYHPMRRVVRIENPLSDGQSLMRTNLLGSLLDIARHNVARGATALQIFESGTVYRAHKSDELADAESPVFEAHMLGGLLTGSFGGRSWRARNGPAGGLLHRQGARRRRAGHAPRRLVGRRRPLAVPAPRTCGERPRRATGGSASSAKSTRSSPPTGTSTRPLPSRSTSTSSPPLRRRSLAYRGLSDFPAVLQDLSLLLAEDVPAERVLDVVRANAGPELAGVDVLDVYRGDQIGAGRVSLTLHLEFRAADRTLTDAEVADRRSAITAALAVELGGELRA